MAAGGRWSCLTLSRATGEAARGWGAGSPCLGLTGSRQRDGGDSPAEAWRHGDRPSFLMHLSGGIVCNILSSLCLISFI